MRQLVSVRAWFDQGRRSPETVSPCHQGRPALRGLEKLPTLIAYALGSWAVLGLAVAIIFLAAQS
ncbi:hypothetical protein GCM10011611_62660 [Aliidongia dinghuensis]|uniref:Uncharacterized protein n=1 Tax=Aliidongia dinghuensis TaxID=1867774 RepID=A0A8J3E6T0_9PROT|nr:hypothetical protein [Aliidongia dinghuensis]GGF47727.1 hypothetical protein GCM10011611_62660 [Aliidongia dinghuensis]